MPENGLDSDHDQVYLRFLFGLGDRRSAGETLFETFEKVLEEFGIQIEFNTEDDGIQEVTRNLGDIGYDDDEVRHAAASGRRELRGRSQYTHDAEDESGMLAQLRADSRASTSRLEISKKEVAVARPASRATSKPNDRMSTFAYSPNIPAATARGRLTADEWTLDLRERMNTGHIVKPSSHLRPSSQKAMMPVRVLKNDEDSLRDEISTNSSDPTDDISQIRSQKAHNLLPFSLKDEERLYAPSKTQLLRDAYIFHSYRIQSVARDAVEKWCHAAWKAKDHHEHMNRIATAHDMEVLLRQAFEHWRLRLHEKKQAIETKRYFDRLERKATRARDLYLLTKAFTHWWQCTQDEVLRTSLARQHILSVKYFHAWKDLTIANHKKAHFESLQKHFVIWKRRYFQVVTDDIKADLAEQRRLLKKAYWYWFWAFCEARAPEWQARRQKQRSLRTWVNAFRINQQRHQMVTSHIEVASKRFFVSIWGGKARKALHDRDIAVVYSRQTVTSRALGAWVRTKRYGPLVQQVSNLMDWRVAGTTFALFIHRYRVEKQAEHLDRLRVMRNAWTHWNDHLRWQTLNKRIDDRHLLEALYRWTIVERLKLLQRLTKQRLKERYLLRLRDHWSVGEAHRNDAFRILETQFTRRSLHLILSQWRLRTRTLFQNQNIAVEFHAPKVMHESLQSMTRKLRGVQTLERVADDAAFYFMAKRTIKQWRVAATESKRRKRRSAYVEVRRKMKMGLARTMLERWHSATTVVLGTVAEATLFDQNRRLRLAVNWYSQWRFSYELVVDLQSQALSHYDEKLLLRHLTCWQARTTYLTELARKAHLYAHSQQQRLAFDCFNRLRLRLIELKGPQATAESLRIRYLKRLFHRTLRHWQEKLANRLERPTPKRAVFSTKSRRTHMLGEGDDQLGAAAARVEEWAELDQSQWIPQLDARPMATPLAGYLNTPSRRAARARALIEDSSTPKGTPIQMRLRAQLNATTPGPTRRGLFGQSATRAKECGIGRLGVPIEGSGSTTVVDRDE